MNKYTGMDAQTYLEQVFRMDKTINLKLAKAEAYRQMATSTTTRYSALPRSASPNLQRNELLLAKAVDAEREADEEIDRLIDLKDQLLTLGSELDDPTLHSILVERYVNLKKWREVAEALGVSKRWVLEQNTKLLKKFGEILRK